MTLLVVGAHAMDAELMSGALAAQAARDGSRVVLLHLTRGERGHPTRTATEFGRQLEREMATAAQALGVEQRWSGLPAPLPAPAVVAPIIAEVIGEIGAKVVVCHWRGSWHMSHRRSHQATLAAADLTSGEISVLYAENCEDLDGFQPDCFAPIGEVYEAWVTSLNCYELFRLSEPGSGASITIPYWAYYTAAARVRGLQANVELAQAFMLGPGSPPAGLGLRCRKQSL